MKRVRVLLVFSSSELGGAERSLTRMALAAGAGVEFTLATLDGPGPWVDWCRDLGGEPVVLGERKQAGSHGRIGVKAMLRLIALVRRQRHHLLYVIGLRASLLVRLAKPMLKAVRIIHGVRWNPDSNSRLDQAFRLVESLTGGLVDLFLCNSRAAAQTLQYRLHIPGNRIRVIYNGLDRLPPQRLDLWQRPLRVVTVANLNPRKGYVEYLDVLENVLRRLPSASFVFVGRDDMGGLLASEIAQRGLGGAVTLTGYQSDVGRWLDEARLMVLPSRWGEGCPTSILEGHAHGLPVVAYAIDGVPELIEDGRDGVLIAPGDALGLADAIVRLLDNTALAQDMGAAGRAKVERCFTLARCADQHVAVFMELVAGSETGTLR